MSTKYVVTALLVLAASTLCSPSNDKDQEYAVRFLRNYGFLTGTESSLSSGNTTALNHAIALFQEYYQLPGNGVLNAETLRLMRKPRCGNHDVPNRNYSAIVRKWPKTHLTWDFLGSNQDEVILTEFAFSVWSMNSSLTFERDTLRPNILISYRTRQHNYANPKNGDICISRLDGPGHDLAHAFFPSGAVDHVAEIHMDQEEPWYIKLDKNPADRDHMLMALIHEIGHSLGLRHSVNRDSIMFAFIPDRPYQFPIKISREDILAIQILYGSKENTNVPETTAAVPTTTISATTSEAPNDPENDLCRMRRFDTAMILNHRLFVAYHHHVWSVNILEKRYGKAVRLTDYVRFLPRNFTRLTAAYQRPSGDLALFVDNLVYMVEYPSFSLRMGWPKTIADIGIPRNAKINAVVNTHAGRTYMIYNDDKVAEIDECYMTATKHTSLQDIFPGVPSGIMSAYRHYDGSLYFFAKNQFYAFNEFTNNVPLAGAFDLSILGIECPTDSLLRQLRDLLGRIYYSYDSWKLRYGDEESNV